ncbi:MAG: type II toxin-antitoxin system HicB family antitoxin [Spirosomataceae bacterium]
MGQTGIEIQNAQHVLNRTFRVVVSYSDEDKVYYASIPSIEGCMTYGDTVEEAMKHIKEAAEGILAVMQEERWDIPDDSQTMEYHLHIPLAAVTS